MRFWERGFFYLWVLFVFSLFQSNLVQAGFWDSVVPVKKEVHLQSVTQIQPPRVLGVQLGESHFVPCEHCGGGGGASQSMKCGPNQVLADFENWVGQYGECDSDWGGCANHAIVGAQRFRCAELGMDKLELPSSYAQTDSGKNIWGDNTDSSKLDHWGDGCLTYNSVPYGIFGRGGDRVDSFGFFCGSYVRTEFKAKVIQASPKNMTYTCAEDTKYGCSPGTGGAEFEVKCPVDEAIVGVRARSGSDVDAIEGVYCAPINFIREIFPVDSK